MDNTPEGENRQTPQSWQEHQAEAPAPFVSPPPPPVSTPPADFSNSQAPAVTNPPTNVVPGGIVDQPHTSLASTLILQWLTYAFWGWTVLILSALTIVASQRLIAGEGDPAFRSYLLAALIVLVPISFVCDSFYSKKEPARKTGPSSLVMVIHAVLFALFAIGSLLFVAWSIVSLGIYKTDRNTQWANLASALVISLFYAATFIRTLNPSHINWIPKAYRFAMLGVVVLIGVLGVLPARHVPAAANNNSSSYSSNSSSDTSTPSNNFGSNGKLEPSVVGGTQCDIPTLSDGSTTGQVAITGGATCEDSDANIQSATGKNGGNYTSGSYSCTSTKQGAGTQWSDYWNNAFYSYNCTAGSKQAAFNLQTTAQSKAVDIITN